MENPTAYDYRMYDHIWQRVSPGCDPYGDIHAAQNERQHTGEMPPSAGSGSAEAMTMPAPQNAQPAPRSEDTLPRAQLDPCCMGSEAMESLEVLEGFIEEELAQRRCYMGLAARVCNNSAARLLRSLAQEKLEAARELKTAYYLITGSCYEGLVSIDHMCWNSLADALRSCYHQEACNGFNYRRAADETVDTCLQKLLGRLSERSFARADAVMELLGHMIC